jgi:hypothetical protein
MGRQMKEPKRQPFAKLPLSASFADFLVSNLSIFKASFI